MHFYEFNIGDFAKKTQHLTNEEELAYRRALDMYYDTEKPLLTSGLATLSRRLRVSENALKNVLDEFFPDGKNKHADEKIAAYYEYIEKQKANGRKGGRPKHDSNKPTANPLVSQNNPVPSQPLTTKPLTNNNKSIVVNDVDNCPHIEIINLYKQIIPSGIQPLTWNGSRANQLKARWRENKKRQNLEWWQGLFEYITKSQFLMGQASNGERKPFMISLDWIVKAENFMKITEGKYHA